MLPSIFSDESTLRNIISGSWREEKNTAKLQAGHQVQSVCTTETEWMHAFGTFVSETRNWTHPEASQMVSHAEAFSGSLRQAQRRVREVVAWALHVGKMSWGSFSPNSSTHAWLSYSDIGCRFSSHPISMSLLRVLWPLQVTLSTAGHLIFVQVAEPTWPDETTTQVTALGML